MALRLLHPARLTNTVQPSYSVAKYHDFVRAAAPGGAMRIPLASPKVIGVANSRGNRSHQEDFYSFATLSLNPEELRASVKKAHGIDWDPTKVGDLFARQVVFVGIYDGHGGSAVSQYLRQELHGLFESVNKAMVPELHEWLTKDIGGYFKRYKGGPLTPWIHGIEDTPELDLEARSAIAFYEVDKNLSSDQIAQSCGATASVMLLHTLDAPAPPFYAAQRVALTVPHCGLGDLKYKKFGVTPEPEIRTKLLEGTNWAYIVAISDGISSILSDDEVVDLARNCRDPQTAANRILSFAQELGGGDNATAIVVPLAGWGQIKGPDRTKDLREYRLQQAGKSSYFSMSPSPNTCLAGSERLRRM
ncbi:hypothetical protein ONZ45_g3020 [Pleurotus djamor]|nr:hypothetical protein ONZ45_g3020 [Pleurotus djamor]